MQKEYSYDCFIYTHIPKCGGSSLRRFLFESGKISGITNKTMHIPGEGNLGNRMNIPNLNEEVLSILKSRNLKIIADHSKYNVHHYFQLNNIKTPFYFTIFRDPIDRFISHYNFFYFKLNYGNLGGVHINDLNAIQLERICKSLGNLQVKFILGYNQQVVNERTTQIAIERLVNNYNSFGILEKMDETLTLLNTVKPKWLTLSNVINKVNQNQKSRAQNKISLKVLKKVKEANIYDQILYDFGLTLFNTKLRLNVK